MESVVSSQSTARYHGVGRAEMRAEHSGNQLISPNRVMGRLEITANTPSRSAAELNPSTHTLDNRPHTSWMHSKLGGSTLVEVLADTVPMTSE
ncbi:hypothetical protein R1flu_027289 [Riccia fluitans]|uniref:Uncharacterized protein n=1 Tax=Riccia fluitans TaxID=41844 RepID=A0ABD1XLB5_9MARC